MSAGAPLPRVEGLERLGDEIGAELRERFAAAGYDAALIGEAESVAPQQFDAVRLPLVHAWLERRGGPGALCAGLFSYEHPARREDAEEALGATLVDALLDAGVLRDRGDRSVEAAYRLVPFMGLHLISDPLDARADAVMGPSPTTLVLARLVPERPGRVVDLGCGAGSLALLAAARGAREAVGVDRNARAIAISRCNARLNGLRAEFLAGDRLEPVRGRRFDRVISQPPYVPRPEGVGVATWLHGGSRGDELPLAFAAAAAEALSESGQAWLLFDAPPSREPVHARLRAALDAAAVDLVALVSPGPSLDLQAAAYASLEDVRLGPGYREAVHRYRAHLEALGGGAFSRVLALLRSCRMPGGDLTAQIPAASLARFDAVALDALWRGLALASSGEAELLDARLRLARGAILGEERSAGALAADPARTLRFAPDALPVGHEISEGGAILLAALDGSVNVAAAVARFAEACGEPPEAVRRKVLDFVREGLGRAWLAPVDSPGGGS